MKKFIFVLNLIKKIINWYYKKKKRKKIRYRIFEIFIKKTAYFLKLSITKFYNSISSEIVKFKRRQILSMNWFKCNNILNYRIAEKERNIKQNSKKVPLLNSNLRSCSHWDTKKTKFLKKLLFLAPILRIYKLLSINFN